jgi:CheY-like chemotaxis protein
MPTPAILIVDDTPTNVDLLECILSAEGFRTLTASDGPSARAISRAAQPDLILLDVMMPEESGFETCARLRADPETADIPVIFLSAMDAPKDRVQGLNSRRRRLHLQADLPGRSAGTGAGPSAHSGNQPAAAAAGRG